MKIDRSLIITNTDQKLLIPESLSILFFLIFTMINFMSVKLFTVIDNSKFIDRSVKPFISIDNKCLQTINQVV